MFNQMAIQDLLYFASRLLSLDFRMADCKLHADVRCIMRKPRKPQPYHHMAKSAGFKNYCDVSTNYNWA